MRQIRPIPYYTRQDDGVMKECARQLRECFKKVMSRRLPMHPMTPWTHSTVIEYVAKHKNDYPYVLRADIEKYYPNVDPFRMIAQVQLAHRDLYALSCVSKSFRETFLARMQLWARSLPAGQGIPLGSAMSYILASMALVPLWLGIKRKFNVKLLVFADDILVLCKDDYTARQVWDYIADRLFADLGVKLNSQKTYGDVSPAGRLISAAGPLPEAIPASGNIRRTGLKYALKGLSIAAARKTPGPLLKPSTGR